MENLKSARETKSEHKQGQSGEPGHSHAGEHSGGEHFHPRRKEVLNRLARIIGHLEGIKRMVAEDADCSEVLIQLSAVRSALNGAGRVVLDDHIRHCLRSAYAENNMAELEKLSDAIAKFLK
ncbi:MAG: metal-sensing transcriptional repressor [Gracilibacteraceae bacterium]|jgi:DNA-binding FrmR family transcriptional regulator|nr:metal-sensing transcriptional repressor [Gracilibacteraceae bacterium]